MKLLVTGGAGFMGSYFIKYMLQKYSHVSIINVDKLTYAGNLENLKEIEHDQRYRFIKADISDSQIVEELIKTEMIDVIINYAAETHVDRSVLDPKAFINSNVVGVYSLLEIAKKYNTKFLQISTDEVFGSIEQGGFNERSAFEPNSPYSAAKAGGDLMCRAYYETFKVPVIVTHCCNVMGPFQFPEKMIPLFITNLLEDKKIPLYGDGLNVREWIYVEDHSIAIDFILHNGVWGQVYNIGTGFEKTNLEMTDIILKKLGKDSSFIEYVEDRKGHDRRYAIDSTKLRAMGWKPHYDFEVSLDLIMQWYQSNPDWWKKVRSGEYQSYYDRQYNRK